MRRPKQGQNAPAWVGTHTHTKVDGMNLTGSRNVVNTPTETAATWFATTFCRDCKAARLLVWQRDDYDTDGPA